MSYLVHHGIKGQKWGKRNGPPYPLDSGNRSASERKAGLRASSSKPDNKNVKSSGLHLTDKQKKYIKIGAGVAVGLLAAYAGYKLYQSGAFDSLVKKGRVSATEKLRDLGTDITKVSSYNSLSEDNPWFGSLSENERTALNKYTGFYFQPINRAARNIDNPNVYKDDDILKAIKDMDSAIDRFELKEPQSFIRYATADFFNGASTEGEIRALIGSKIHDDGFASSSLNSETSIDGFWKNGKSIKCVIKTPSGKGIGAWLKPISQKPEENEFLFGRGSNFEITNVRTDNDGLVVELAWINAMRKMIP